MASADPKCRENLYRTRWLAAHNNLHDIVHKGTISREAWRKYQEELANADQTASADA